MSAGGGLLAGLRAATQGLEFRISLHFLQEGGLNQIEPPSLAGAERINCILQAQGRSSNLIKTGPSREHPSVAGAAGWEGSLAGREERNTAETICCEEGESSMSGYPRGPWTPISVISRSRK